MNLTFFGVSTSWHRLRKLSLPFFFLAWIAFAGLFASLAQAQLRVDISGTGAQQYPIAIADFSGDPAGQLIAEVIRADLTRSGQFRWSMPPVQA